MTVIQERDLIDSVADALQVLSFKSSNRGEGEQLVLRANDVGTANSNLLRLLVPAVWSVTMNMITGVKLPL